jgi:O-antigen/teichoic acid export membrane protein
MLMLLLLLLLLQTMAALLQKYLQVQGLVGPPAVTSGISILLNIAANWAGLA